jgi:hypothetical protein
MNEHKLNISSRAFWDIDFIRLMLQVNEYPEYIIKRVFEYGSFEDMMKVLKYFGEDKVREVLTNTTYLPAKTLNFVSILLETDKTKFRCYKNKRYRRSFSKF